jgi:hypothetical protein
VTASALRVPLPTHSPPVTAHGYARLVERIREIVGRSVAETATVLVVSRGDDALVDLPVHAAWHFPRDADGRYAGYHPDTAESAIAHLETLRTAGADHLLLPRTAFWWMRHYARFARFLVDRFRITFRDDDVCLIFGLAEPPAPADPQPEEAAGRVPPALAALLRALLPPGARVALLGADALPRLDVADADSGAWDRWQPGVPTAAGELIRQTDDLAAAGIAYLVVPPGAFSLLEGEPALLEHLRRRHRLVTHQEHAGQVYRLHAGVTDGDGADGPGQGEERAGDG